MVYPGKSTGGSSQVYMTSVTTYENFSLTLCEQHSGFYTSCAPQFVPMSDLRKRWTQRMGIVSLNNFTWPPSKHLLLLLCSMSPMSFLIVLRTWSWRSWVQECGWPGLCLQWALLARVLRLWRQLGVYCKWSIDTDVRILWLITKVFFAFFWAW